MAAIQHLIAFPSLQACKNLTIFKKFCLSRFRTPVMKIPGRVEFKKIRTMNIKNILYQVWHYGMILLLYNWHFQNLEFTRSELICLPILFLVFFAGLIFYYFKQFIRKSILSSKTIFTIISCEFFLFVVLEVLIFLFGWSLDSPPG